MSSKSTAVKPKGKGQNTASLKRSISELKVVGNEYSTTAATINKSSAAVLLSSLSPAVDVAVSNPQELTKKKRSKNSKDAASVSSIDVTTAGVLISSLPSVVDVAVPNREISRRKKRSKSLKNAASSAVSNDVTTGVDDVTTGVATVLLNGSNSLVAARTLGGRTSRTDSTVRGELQGSRVVNASKSLQPALQERLVWFAQKYGIDMSLPPSERAKAYDVNRFMEILRADGLYRHSELGNGEKHLNTAYLKDAELFSAPYVPGEGVVPPEFKNQVTALVFSPKEKDRLIAAGWRRTPLRIEAGGAGFGQSFVNGSAFSANASTSDKLMVADLFPMLSVLNSGGNVDAGAAAIPQVGAVDGVRNGSVMEVDAPGDDADGVIPSGKVWFYDLELKKDKDLRFFVELWEVGYNGWKPMKSWTKELRKKFNVDPQLYSKIKNAQKLLVEDGVKFDVNCGDGVDLNTTFDYTKYVTRPAPKK
jgi:hypothetical protein